VPSEDTLGLTASPRLSGRIAFTNRGFTFYILARWSIVTAVEMQSVAVGWQVYYITRRPLDLGLIGLAQFLPGILLFLLSGIAADRFNRRKVLLCCYSGYATCSALLLWIARSGAGNVNFIFAVMVLVGIVRSFTGPASRAIMPLLVPDEHFPNAVAWNSNAFQSATILGPALGGLVYAIAHGPSAVYGAALAAALVAFVSIFQIELRPKTRQREPFSLSTVFAGFRYIFEHKMILGSISLDLFAMLLGGAVALLPVYAHDILHTGPWGLGFLRCAMAVGASAMSVLLAYRPLRSRAGAIMLWCVGGFGAFTIVFGLSRSLALSLVALLLAGAADAVSVYVRAILVQLLTPDEMRGRVNAVDMIFIGASNQLGEFESGLTAQWFGTVPAVVIGGAGAILVTILWAWAFPDLRQVDSLTSPNH
jgi:MFS family permease